MLRVHQVNESATQGVNSMRDYLSPAKRVVERVLPQPANIKAFVYKKRAFVFLMAATFVVITTLGFVTVRAMTVSDNKEQNVVKEEGKTSTLSTTTTNESTQPESTMSTTMESNTMTTPSNSSESKTEVKINNQPIDVPENGSVHRTITTENGTTQINVSTNSDSSGNSYSSSFTTNSTNSNTTMNSSSQSINITTQ